MVILRDSKGPGAVTEIVNAIRELVTDHGKLHRMSAAGQRKFFDRAGYENSQGKVFTAMDERIARQRQNTSSLESVTYLLPVI